MPKVSVGVRLPPGDRDLAARAAEIEGTTLSAFLSRLIGPAIREHLLASVLTTSHERRSPTMTPFRPIDPPEQAKAFAAAEVESSDAALRTPADGGTPATGNPAEVLAAQVAAAQAVEAQLKALSDKYGSAPGGK